ncbi:MAG: hypothetical protein KI785_01065 [Devosiaceae bacterium]|nr:hypothetical protein [Devosiaceae bacterium MH13]
MAADLQVPVSDKSLGVRPDELSRWMSRGAGLCVFDVRKPPAFAGDPRLIEGAARLVPSMIPMTLGALRLGAFGRHRLVMVCVHGHAVSQTAAMIARCHAFDACYLVGGFEAWCADGRPLASALHPPTLQVTL